jgi:hypothetical protein
MYVNAAALDAAATTVFMVWLLALISSVLLQGWHTDNSKHHSAI